MIGIKITRQSLVIQYYVDFITKFFFILKCIEINFVLFLKLVFVFKIFAPKITPSFFPLIFAPKTFNY